MRQGMRAYYEANDNDSGRNCEQEFASHATAALGRIRQLVQGKAHGTIRNQTATPENPAKLAQAHRSNARAVAKG